MSTHVSVRSKPFCGTVEDITRPARETLAWSDERVQTRKRRAASAAAVSFSLSPPVVKRRIAEVALPPPPPPPPLLLLLLFPWAVGRRTNPSCGKIFKKDSRKKRVGFFFFFLFFSRSERERERKGVRRDHRFLSPEI